MRVVSEAGDGWAAGAEGVSGEGAGEAVPDCVEGVQGGEEVLD